MTRLFHIFGQPCAWLTAGLCLLAAGGATILAQPVCAPVEAEQFRWFWARHAWQSAFDALSAVCGVGLLTRDLDQHYTPAGRWTLWVLGQCGALLYLAATAQLARRACRSHGDARPGPSTAMVIGAFIGLEVVVIAWAWIAANRALPLDSASYLAGAAFASVGVSPPELDRASAGVVALAGLAGGWMLPLLILGLAPALRSLVGGLARALALAAGYLVLLALAALLMSVLEAPRGAGQGIQSRGHPPGAADERTLSLHDSTERFTRCLVQSAGAATAGIATETLGERHVRDATKFVLALLVLMGAFGGSTGGGVTFLLIASAIIARRGAARGDEARRAFARAAAALLMLLPALALTVAFGLLAIEALTASAYQPTFTFAEALVDAASAVAGANLTSGLTAVVTDPNLTQGLGLGVNQYEYAMVWLMAAMLVGRLLPIFVLSRATGRALSPQPVGS